MVYTLTLASLIVTLTSAYSARILTVLPIGAKSHHRFMQPLVMALAQAGHQVVVYNPFPTLLDDHHHNLTHVLLRNVNAVEEINPEFVQKITEHPFWKCLDLLWILADDVYSEVISDNSIKELFSSNETFDLIISESFNSQEFLTFLLSWKFKVPVIGLHTFHTHNIVNSFLGNPLSLSYIPDVCTVISDKMSFLERMSNVFASLRGLYYHYNYYLPKFDRKIRRDFPGAPSLSDLSRILSLVFVNDHLAADYAHPRTPNMVPVAGIHIRPTQPLPQEIKKFMDEAKDGVVFFSLGTYVLDELQPKEYFEMYNNVFRKLKQRVIWKTRKEKIEDLPSNVMSVKWAPQNDILAHPACVLFITHGGQLSRVEALHFGVPVVSIAQFFDQHRNSRFYEETGVGVRIRREDVTEEKMSSAIAKVLYDPSYRENMKKLSTIFRDRPLSPAESVVFWTEYVLRHGGAAHLRPASTELRWYQLFLLDILLVSVLVISFAFYIISLLLKILRFTSMSVSQKFSKKKFD